MCTRLFVVMYFARSVECPRDEGTLIMNIVMYSGKLCGDCQLLKAFMDRHGIAYENRDIRENPKFGEELEATTGKLGVPYLVIDGEWVRGYEPGQPFSDDFAKQLFGLA